MYMLCCVMRSHYTHALLAIAFNFTQTHDDDDVPACLRVRNIMSNVLRETKLRVHHAHKALRNTTLDRVSTSAEPSRAAKRVRAAYRILNGACTTYAQRTCVW